jgi:hypothetical protein
MKRSFKKRKSGQQLVEFLLVAPFFVIIFGILTEYAYALSINMTLEFGLKNVTSQIYSQMSPNMTADDIDNKVKDELVAYLDENKVPLIKDKYKVVTNLNVSHINNGDNCIFIAGYKYVVAFTLPKAYFRFMPDEFNFSATSLIPKAFIKCNGYQDAISNDDLAKVWGNNMNAGSIESLASYSKGIMNEKTGATGGNVDKMRFLVPINADYVDLKQGLLIKFRHLINIHNYTTYAIFKWDGSYEQVNGMPLLAITDSDLDGELYYYRSGRDSWGWPIKFHAQYRGWDRKDSNYASYLQNEGVTNIIFYDFDVSENSTACTDTASCLSRAQKIWNDDSEGNGATNVVDNDGGILKSALALVIRSKDNSGDLLQINGGNYDNIEVYEYAPSIAIQNIYKTDTLGSMVIVHTDRIDLDCFKNLEIMNNGF